MWIDSDTHVSATALPQLRQNQPTFDFAQGMDILKKIGSSGFLKRSPKDINEHKTELDAKIIFIGNLCGKTVLLRTQVFGHKNWVGEFNYKLGSLDSVL